MKVKHIITTILSTVITFGAAAQAIENKFGNAENISDVVLIYAGNDFRNEWTESQFTPYVTHTYADGKEDWFFDSFLFLEFANRHYDNGVHQWYAFGNGMGGDKPAKQADWTWILDEYFNADASKPLTKLAALDRLIGEKKAQLGEPPFRHKVIIMCPGPKKDGNVWSEDIWGEIDGKQVSLFTEENRLAAVKWYIDQLCDRWEKAGYTNIDLEGIYWVEEGMISNAGIIADVNDYARTKGLHSYWIPYYRSGNEPYCQRWKSDYKFDMCYYQPNYAFYTDNNGGTYPKSQLTRTVENAKVYGAGLEFEFETSGTSNALHSSDPLCHQRLIDYIDTYEEKGVFDNAGVAYYCGTRGFNHMHESQDPADHAAIDRLASIVKARHDARRGTAPKTLVK